MTISTLFLIIALVLFVLAAFNVPARNVALGWLGAAFVVAAMLIGSGVMVG